MVEYRDRQEMQDVALAAREKSQELFVADDHDAAIHSYLLGITEALNWATGEVASPNLEKIVARTR